MICEPSIRGCVAVRKTSSESAPSQPSNDLEYIEEHYGQLWSIPSPPRRRSNPNPFLPKPFPATFWVRKDLLAAGKFTKADYQPATVRSFDPPPKLICLPCEGIGPGSRSFAEVVKGRVEMADKRPSGSSSGAASQWGGGQRAPAPQHLQGTANSGKDPVPV